MFSNVSIPGILIPEFLYDRSEFLSFVFKYLAVKNVSCINITYPIS